MTRCHAGPCHPPATDRGCYGPLCEACYRAASMRRSFDGSVESGGEG